MTVQPQMVMLVVAPLIMWRIYKRVQRLMVRQKSKVWRHWVGALLLPVLLLAAACTMLDKPLALAALAGGAVCGVAIGIAAMRRSHLECVDGIHFYTPDARIGLFISTIFIGRLLYRGYEFYLHGPQRVPDFGSSPLTMALMGLVGAFYASYAIGLLRWRRASPAPAIALPPQT